MSRTSASRSSILLAASVVIILASMLGMTALGLASRREQALENARRESLARASLIASRLDATLRVVSGVLEQAAASLDPDKRALAHIAARLGESRNAYRVDRDGRIRASAFGREPDGLIYFPDLALLASNTGIHYHVGMGRLGGEGTEPVLMAARRLDDASGAYDGVVLVAFGPEVLDDRIALLLGYALDSVSLEEPTGGVLLAFRHGAGAVAPSRDEPAIVASTALSAAPFRLSVAIGESRILEPWRHYARDLLLAELFLLLIAGGFGIASLLNSRKSERMRKLLMLQASHTVDGAKEILSHGAEGAVNLIVNAALHSLEARSASLRSAGISVELSRGGPEGASSQDETHEVAVPGEPVGSLAFVRMRAFSDEERMLCGTFAVLAGLAIEVGRRREAEASLERALVDKNALFQELNHRVKNNLAMVQTLLDMGSDSAGDEGAELLRSASARIQAIALVHEQLYACASLKTVEFGPYLARLGGAMLQAYAPQGRVELGIGADSGLWMGMQEATTIGLIANELIMNAFKHAFPEGRHGRIQIEARRHGDQGLRIRIADDGVGMRTQVGETRRGSMGMTIMKALAGQLRASLEFGSGAEGGTSAILEAEGCLVSRDGQPDVAGAGCP